MKASQIVKQISDSELSQVIGQGFAELYREKPEFPISYLASWLKSYSAAKNTKKALQESKKQKEERIKKLEEHHSVQKKQKQEAAHAAVEANDKKNKQFEEALNKHSHLGDLLSEWLPEYIEKYNGLTGAYVGKLDYRKKPLEDHNFEQGSENDTESPKVIKYVGCSKSHEQLMRDKLLPNEQGISYEVFNEPEEEAGGEQEEGAAKPEKKPYRFVADVLKEQKLFYFKFPRLGSYACYPLRIKSYLNVAALDKGIADYRQYLKNKQEAESEYKQKLTEARTEAEDAGKKAEDFEVLEEDPSTEEQKKVLVSEYEELEAKVKELEENPPVIEEVVFESTGFDYFLGCDTLGQDRAISQFELEEVASKVATFKQQWEAKEKAMLLKDILLFLEDENTLENVENQFQEHERNISNNYEAATKEQFQNREKEGEFEYAVVRCEKLCALFHDPLFRGSMEVYLQYSVPKYGELIQVWCMLLGFGKDEINLPDTNTLNHRKMISKESIEALIEGLRKYELRRDSSGECRSEEFKINKLLERIEKIDLEVLAKYNGFLLLVANVLKAYCWARIFCRDARIESHEAKVKAREDRDQEITKWDEDFEKGLEAAKAEPVEEDQPPFNEEEWVKNYESENPKPLPLQVPEFQSHLDIE